MLSIANENDFNFDTHKYSVLKFWATWCGPCKVFAPVVGKLNDEFESINFYSVDVDQVPALARKFKIKTVPTLVFLEGGEEVNRITGMQMIKPLRAELRKFAGQEEPVAAASDKEAAV